MAAADAWPTANVTALRRAYVASPEFGLVLGAGVTIDSRVPGYADLAVRMLERAAERGLLEDAVTADWVSKMLEVQRSPDRVPPDELILFLRGHVRGGSAAFRRLMHDALYGDTGAKRIVPRRAFVQNATLNAILTFCAARGGSPVAGAAPVSAPSRSRRAYDIETNAKVAAILTTNFDNLLEGAFHTRYRRKLLLPVGRPTSREAFADRRVIPVYHIHGYIHFDPERVNDGVDSTLVIAEDDYFRAFYDPLGFSSYVAMSFLRRLPCLFIGCSMADRNLRRFLMHLTGGRRGSEAGSRFAILPADGRASEQLTSAVLERYGVRTIRVNDFAAIPDLLRELYVAMPGVGADDWERLRHYRPR